MSDQRLNDPDYWDALVANYEAQGHPFTAYFAEAALAKLDMGPSTRVLDVATGPGRSHSLPPAPAQRSLRSTFLPEWCSGSCLTVFHGSMPERWTGRLLTCLTRRSMR